MCRNKTLYASAILFLLSTGCSPAERSETGEIETAGLVDAFQIHVGDCFNDRMISPDEVTDVPGVPCSEPHDNEVFATFDLPGDEWQGVDWVNEAGDAGCVDRFYGAIGVTYEESVLYITTLIPTRESWEQINDREVVCVAYHGDYDKLTGTVLNSAK